MTDNGKRIAEVRAFTPEISTKNCTSKKCFPLTKLIKKWAETFFATKFHKIFNAAFNPAF